MLFLPHIVLWHQKILPLHYEKKLHAPVYELTHFAMKMEHAIVVSVVTVLGSICMDNISCKHLWRIGDAIVRSPYATL